MQNKEILGKRSQTKVEAVLLKPKCERKGASLHIFGINQPSSYNVMAHDTCQLGPFQTLSKFHKASLNIYLARYSDVKRRVFKHSQHFTKHFTKHSTIELYRLSCNLLVQSVGVNKQLDYYVILLLIG